MAVALLHSDVWRPKRRRDFRAELEKNRGGGEQGLFRAL